MVLLKIFNQHEIDTNEPISTFEVGEHVVGRGSFPNCMDKRISRRHIVINVKNNEATLMLIHVTPIFFMSKDSPQIRIFNKNDCIILSDGDKFAFLVDTWYTVKIEENQSTNENLVGSTVSAARISNSISSNTVVASISETIISQPTSCKRSADDLYSGKEKKIKLLNNNVDILEDNSEKIVSVDNQNNTEDIKASPSEVENNKTTEVLKIFQCVSDSDDEDSDAEMLPEVTCDTEVVNGVQDKSEEHSQLGDTEDKNDNQKSSEVLDASKSEPMIETDEIITIVPQEAKSMIGDDNNVDNSKDEGISDTVGNEDRTAETSEDNENTRTDGQDPADATASSSSTSVVNRLRREQCWYGRNCYRKNPGHRNQFSHPGDSDNGTNSDEDNRPQCPYGAQCYRTNPQHRQDYKHPTSRPASRPSTNNRRTRHRNENTHVDYDTDSLDEGDPFSADESSSGSEVFEDGDSDSDYLEEPNDRDDSEEVKIMFKEAKTFLRKKR